MALSHANLTKQVRISHVAQVIESVIPRLMMKICYGSDSDMSDSLTVTTKIEATHGAVYFGVNEQRGE